MIKPVNYEWGTFWIHGLLVIIYALNAAIQSHLGKPTWLVGLWILLGATALIRMVLCRGFRFLIRVFIRSIRGDVL